MGYSIVVGYMQHINVYMGILYGCTLYIMICYNYFLLSPPLYITSMGKKSPDNLSVKILFPSLLCVATIILFISPILFIKLSHVYPNNCFVISPIHRSLSVAYDFCLWPTTFISLICLMCYKFVLQGKEYSKGCWTKPKT